MYLVIHQENLEDLNNDSQLKMNLKDTFEIDGEQWLIQNAREELEELGESGGLEELHEEWPSYTEPALTPVSVLDIRTLEPRPRLHIALVPSEFSWEIPVWLNFGGWNACPFPKEHVAVLKYWFESHGARPVAMTSNVIELFVGRPIATQDEALKLAEQQFAYCGDIVAQGTGTLERLAATLINATIWYFWWD